MNGAGERTEVSLENIRECAGLMSSWLRAILISPKDYDFATEAFVTEAKEVERILKLIFYESQKNSDLLPRQVTARWADEFLRSWDDRNPDFSLWDILGCLEDLRQGLPVGTYRIRCAKDFMLDLKAAIEKLMPPGSKPDHRYRSPY